MVPNLVLCGLLGKISQRRQYNEAKNKIRCTVCDMSDRHVESSGTPVVVLRSSECHHCVYSNSSFSFSVEGRSW